jgi:hypothetical protein
MTTQDGRSRSRRDLPGPQISEKATASLNQHGCPEGSDRVYEQVLREGMGAEVLHYIDPDGLVELFDELVPPPQSPTGMGGMVRTPRCGQSGVLSMSSPPERSMERGKHRDSGIDLGP